MAIIITGGKEFSAEFLLELQQLASTYSRCALAKLVCQRLNWLGPTGQPALMSARKTLSELHRLGHLPAPLHPPPPPRQAQAEARWPVPTVLPPSSLAETGPLELVRVTGRRSKSAVVWKQITAHHPLGNGPLCGHQLRYLIKSPSGYLGALAFGAAALQLKARDQAIGWSELSRRHQLHRVVNNTRFLLLPWVQVPNLASQVLGLCTRVLPEDWFARYGYRPVLLETFVDPARFDGISYAAAGWECLGLSAGRGRQERHHEVNRSQKSIWIKPLTPTWREELQAPPVTVRLAPPKRPIRIPLPEPEPAHWAEQEFRAAQFGDQRLTQRLITVARDFSTAPNALIPEACGSTAKTVAAYRFFKHAQVKSLSILASHREQTLLRMQAHKVVLAVQDTTELDYTDHPKTTGLGPIGNHRPHVQGLELHPTVVFTPEGIALGVLDSQCWKRDPDDPTKKAGFRRAVAEKEGVKWLKGFAAAEAAQAACPTTCVVSVGDCEADMYELFLRAASSPTTAKLLVRAYRSRTQTDSTEIWTTLGSRPENGKVRVHLPQRGNRPAREVELTVRYTATELKAPDYMKPGTPSVHLWAILLREETPVPPGAEAVEWMLLTNLPVESFESAVEKTQWYGIRFQIEVYFRTLKTGVRMEDVQLSTRDRLENCLAINLVVAWQILFLSRSARQTPECLAEAYFDEPEMRVLAELVHQENPTQPPAPVILRQAVRIIAKLGGFLGRKGDGEPGAQTLWRGLLHLRNMVRGFALADAAAGRPVPSRSVYG